ncbi:hypothetical protein DPMN_071425 [Dreissena polymorpha]|uniref:Uncharacterized protein n=1 Tax=Dreissena polymorpha TaxID=45954 RepID=A0A9D4BPM6_DREPO|nr:hypothetical protein DPMN_071425 [Dreissena polymorpha]
MTLGKNVTSRVFTCFHYIYREKNYPPTGGHVFSTIWTIFELVRHINKTNVSINFHDDWARIVTYRVFTRKTVPPTGGHLHEDWALNVTSMSYFELDRDIIWTNLLTNKCGLLIVYEQMWTDDGRTDGQTPQSGKLRRPPGNHVFQRTGTIFKLNSRIKETKVLTKFHGNWAKNVTF